MSVNKRVESVPSDFSSLWYAQSPSEQDRVNGEAPVALLIHGLTASPGELQPLADHLFAKGFEVVVPCLRGHGTSIESLECCTAEEWLSDLDEAFNAVCAQGERKVLLAGVSFGALLGMEFLSRYSKNISAGILLAPPLLIKPRWLQLLLSFLVKLPRSITESFPSVSKKKRQVHFVFPRFSYPRHSLAALVELGRVQMLVQKQRRLSLPILAVFEPKDHLIDVCSAERLRRLIQPRLELRWLPGADHEMSVGPRVGKLHDFIDEFLSSHEFLNTEDSNAT